VAWYNNCHTSYTGEILRGKSRPHASQFHLVFLVANGIWEFIFMFFGAAFLGEKNNSDT